MRILRMFMEIIRLVMPILSVYFWLFESFLDFRGFRLGAKKEPQTPYWVNHG